MKFITEYDLRAKFNEQPFTDYRIDENTRLTPGARQFLSDRRINLLEGEEETRTSVMTMNQKEQEDSLEIAKLVSSMEILEAEFLVVTSQIVGEDIEIAEQMLKVGHEIGKIRLILTGETVDSDVCFEECTWMNEENCCQDLGNCFEMSDFYIQSANGKMLVQMNVLRAEIRAIRIDLAQILSAPEDEKRLIAATEAVNRIINKLSQLMCVAAGVKECKRTL